MTSFELGREDYMSRIERIQEGNVEVLSRLQNSPFDQDTTSGITQRVGPMEGTRDDFGDVGRATLPQTHLKSTVRRARVGLECHLGVTGSYFPTTSKRGNDRKSERWM